VYLLYRPTRAGQPLCRNQNKNKKKLKMITIDHDAKEGKLKVYMIGVSQIFLAGILLTLVHILFKKQINGLEQALS
jgi:hypothetical protein